MRPRGASEARPEHCQCWNHTYRAMIPEVGVRGSLITSGFWPDGEPYFDIIQPEPDYKERWRAFVCLLAAIAAASVIKKPIDGIKLGLPPRIAHTLNHALGQLRSHPFMGLIGEYVSVESNGSETMRPILNIVLEKCRDRSDIKLFSSPFGSQLRFEVTRQTNLKLGGTDQLPPATGEDADALRFIEAIETALEKGEIT